MLSIMEFAVLDHSLNWVTLIKASIICIARMFSKHGKIILRMTDEVAKTNAKMF